MLKASGFVSNMAENSTHSGNDYVITVKNYIYQFK